MANEAVLVTRTGYPLQFACSSTATFEKGALVRLSGANTVIAPTANDDFAGGIVAYEKINDGTSTVAVYREGRFKVTLSGSCLAGEAVSLSVSPNHVKAANLALSGSRILGRTLEPGTTGQTILIELDIGQGVSN